MPSFICIVQTDQNMSKIVYLFGGVAAALYVWVAAKLALRLRHGAAITADTKRLPIAVGMGAVTLHALTLHSTLLTPQGVVNYGFFNAVSLLSWIVALLVLAGAIRRPVENLGIAVLPLAAIGVVLSMLFHPSPAVLDEHAVGLNLHIFISVLAFSLLNIAAIQAILLAIQNRHLRNRHPGGFIRALPPLETMERMLFQVMAFGFVLQTLSLATGFAFLKDMFAQHLAHKTVLAITAWLIFGILLFGRWRYGWRGRKAINWTVSGFVVLLLAYIGSKLVLELVLKRQ
jgi:ABC-type uncharacterized transport system permease subunit